MTEHPFDDAYYRQGQGQLRQFVAALGFSLPAADREHVEELIDAMGSAGWR